MGCTKCKETPCTQKTCGCPVKDLEASCVTYKGEALTCTGIETPDTVDVIIKKIDTAICEKFGSITNFINLINVGDGAEIYKGVDNLGRKEIRTLTSSDDSVTITQNENEIDLTANLPEVNDVVSFGTGNPVYVGQNGNDDYQITTLEDVSGNDYFPIYKEYETGNHKFVGINSDDLVITEDSDGNLTINAGFDDGIPRFIVNNLYQGVEETGSLSKPFKTIQGAVDEVIGNGTTDAPQYNNALIIIQRGNVYNFSGNFSVRNLSILVEQSAEINHTPIASGYLIDYDTLTASQSETTLTLQEDSVIRLNENGVRNSGSDGSSYKSIYIKGSGTIRSIKSTYNASTSIIESNITNNPSYSGNNSNPYISCDGVFLISSQNAIYRVGGGATTLYFNNCELRSSFSNSNINVGLRAFHQEGGNVFLENCLVIMDSNNNRELGFTMNKTSSVNLQLQLVRCILQTKTDSIFAKTYDGTNPEVQPDLTVLYCTSRFSQFNRILYNGNTDNWSSITLNRNTFHIGVIERDYISMTRLNTKSVTNNFGDDLVEDLVEFTNEAAAISAGLPHNAKFFNTTSGIIDIVRIP